MAANVLLPGPEDVVMAKVIAFYVPSGYRKKATARSYSQRGKIIEFRAMKKSA